MNNLEKLATPDTQDTKRSQAKQKAQHNMYWAPLYANKDNKRLRSSMPGEVREAYLIMITLCWNSRLQQ